MQFLDVLIDQKTKQWDATFSYAISPEWLAYVQIGSIVEVPFGNKTFEGIVVGLKKNPPRDFKGQLKPIKRIIQPQVRITREELDFAKWMAVNYLCTWSEAAFAMLPPVPKKELGDEGRIEPLVKQDGKTYILLENEEKRHQAYIDIINKNKMKKRIVWIIFADLMKIDNFLSKNKAQLTKFELINYRASDNLKNRFEKWRRVRTGNCDVVVGSRMTMLCLPTNVATIIIDESSQSGHIENQSPQYNSLELARYWQEKMGLTVLEADAIVTLRQLVEAKNKQSKLVSKQIVKPECQINLVDMNKEKRLISLFLENAIEKTIENEGILAILMPKKGLGAVTKCTDCDFIYNCPKCEIPLKYFENKNMLICSLCNHQQTLATSCPKCRGINLATMGLGLEKVSNWVKKIVNGRYEVINLDKETVLEDFDKKAIYVTTQAIFRYPIRPNISAIVDTDLFLTKPDYSTNEIAFYTIYRLALITKDELMIQTRDVETELYLAIKAGRYHGFLQTILKERFDNCYPPYGQLFKIESKDIDEKKAENRLRKLVKLIGEKWENVQTIGPMPAYNPKERGEFKFQLILKTDKMFDKKRLREILNKDLKLEINPGSLL